MLASIIKGIGLVTIGLFTVFMIVTVIQYRWHYLKEKRPMKFRFFLFKEASAVATIVAEELAEMGKEKSLRRAKKRRYSLKDSFRRKAGLMNAEVIPFKQHANRK